MTGKPDAPPASPDSLATRAGCCHYPHAIQKEAEAQRRASARPGSRSLCGLEPASEAGLFVLSWF